MLVVASFAYSAPTFAQGVTPTPEQLEMLRNLTPEQQEQIRRRIGGDQSSTTRGGTPRQGDQQRGNAQPGTGLTPRPSDDEEEEREPAIPILKTEDSVIINVSLQPEDLAQPGAPPQPAQAGVVQSGAPAAATPGALSAVPGAPGAMQPSQPRRSVELTDEEKERLQKLVDLIRTRNPYRLSREGVLNLPGFAGIPLAGLTEYQATLRLQAEPALRDLYVSLVRLPLKKIGSEALKPFGYDLFDQAPSTFAPVTDVPVPSDYIVGAGDVLNIQLYGNRNESLTLVVGRDGRINFPGLGPVSVSGETFNSAKASIESRVERQMIGVRASLSMGDTRSIRVFVLGEARRAGTYTISGLGTITSALFAAGGVKRIGSLRDIQLKRQGVVVRHLDLYDMLIRGSTVDDAKLLPGDVVFIPPVGPTVSVGGEVRRPAIYEVKTESTTAEVIELAGGLTPEADTSRAALTRIDERRDRVVVTVNLATNASSQPVRNGDLLIVSRLAPTLNSGVTVDGYVYSPGTYAFHEGLRLSEVIRSVDELKPNADIHYLLVRRELPPNRIIAAVSADLGAALSAPGSAADLVLMPRDRITVFDLESGRQRVIGSLLNELRLQSNIGKPTEIVSIDGRVKAAGDYPLEIGMRVSDLIRAGGSLSDAAYGGKAELTRYRSVNGDTRRTELIVVDLAAVMRGDAAANILLEPFDNLSIKELPEWGSQEHVTLQGEVRFPGRYSIKRGETLSSVVGRAGGLTDFAFPEGSVFTRDELKDREQKQLDVLARRLQNDLSTLALQGAAANQAQAGTALTVGQSLLSQLRTSQAVGRLVIDLPRALHAKKGSDADVIMRNGDRLIVPKFQQEVTVIGEVQNATSHLYRPELGRDDYINFSGGTTRRADHDKIYVVHADGSVVASESGRWFSRGAVVIKAGDTIVVPMDTERLPALPFWQAVTQIIYNLAISAAAVNSF